ncbi:FAD-dependent monooxygenase [Streptomyces sp. NPDC047014]|uniref:FAD-dependent monooxygenase n=1 Tax=Streptomyces sp. NPDC047014 TaxID=3155736 RepID=UPI003402DAEB
MAHSSTTDVLVVGAGPIGLTAAAELRRSGVSCRIVDRLASPLPYAKAVGIQPRTLEIWDRMDMIRPVLDAAVTLRGQLTYVNGAEQPRVDLVLPPEVPYGFAALPQYEAERILTDQLTRWGTGVERGTELVSFQQDADGVTSRLRTASGAEEELRTRYLVGCDGAHSTVRKGLGLSFEGGALPEEFMLADIELDWDLPNGYTVRSMLLDDSGAVDDVLVCIPLPGGGRYRVSTRVAPELSTAARAGTGGAEVSHGLQSGRGPSLTDIQTVLDRLAPVSTTASTLRWSSVFRISHRIVDRYGSGRVFVAGDAAHIHPPTGAQGMNTGIQDAWNLAWKLALAVTGTAAPGLLASYDAERRPVGEEVVGRTLRHSARGVQSDPEEPETLILREAQLLVGYRGSPVVDPPGDGPAPGPGDRAPDCTGLTSRVAAFPLRLGDLLRERDHVLLLYGSGLDELARTAWEISRGQVEACVILPADAAPGARDSVPAGPGLLPVYHDIAGEFARLYAVDAPTAFLIRPDGYLAARLTGPDPKPLADRLAAVFAAGPAD